MALGISFGTWGRSTKNGRDGFRSIAKARRRQKLSHLRGLQLFSVDTSAVDAFERQWGDILNNVGEKEGQDEQDDDKVISP